MQFRASLVVQWLRILLAVQGTPVQSLAQERSHMQGNWARELKVLSPLTWSPCYSIGAATTVRSLRATARVPSLLSATKGSPCAAMKTQHSQKINKERNKEIYVFLSVINCSPTLCSSTLLGVYKWYLISLLPNLKHSYCSTLKKLRLREITYPKSGLSVPQTYLCMNSIACLYCPNGNWAGGSLLID